MNFGAWSEEVQADLDTLKTVKSPKDVFFPQSETLYAVRKEGKKLTVEPEALKDQDFVVFGMRACDVKGVQVLDRVFLADPVDTYYAARRAHGTMVALACGEPEESCFCKVFGVDAADPGHSLPMEPPSEMDGTESPSGADVAAWMVGEYLYWKPVTEKGVILTGLLTEGALPEENADGAGTPEKLPDTGLLEKADSPEELRGLEAEMEKIRGIAEQLPYSGLSLEGWNKEALTEKFNSPLWEELYKPCLACGTCTFVCPTCQCYDIKDYDTGHGVQRYRCWDSCMYSDFTMMAHGNNRNSQMQRFRQRFMHKLVYFPANNDGMYSCVGCGRCVEKCPAALNIVKVIKKFAETSGKAESREKKEKGGAQG